MAQRVILKKDNNLDAFIAIFVRPYCFFLVQSGTLKCEEPRTLLSPLKIIILSIYGCFGGFGHF